MAGSLRLRPIEIGDEQAVRSADRVLADAGYRFFVHGDFDQPWSDLVDRLDRQSRGLDLADGLVPAAFLLAVVGGEIVGRASVRFELNEYLALAGGHIGYAVLQDHRRRGYATEILRQGIALARQHGVGDVLVTCDVTNEGSRRVIERCGGKFESVVHDPRERVDKRRYWIRSAAAE